QMVPHPTQHKSSASSRSSTPQPANHPSAAEITRRINNKRRRDEDFDGASFKRRAVSPGMSVQSSPILAQSPTQKDSGWWGVSKGSASASSNGNNQSQGERVNSGASSSSTSVNGTKRIGIQGMSDTSDNLLKMSIE
ncbi:MAG: hypothetical protein M1833_007270, partial [Piccolia ochrophora]